MRFQLSRHAQEQLERRGIPTEFLDSVLQTPQQIVDEQESKKVYQSQFLFENGKTYLVRAIIMDNTNPAIVLTVYKTSQISKYWRAT
ncbi:MAG TPA: hypothetical protein DDW76_38520 [Cyanobacteria bacterium UBA11369]|nr:hypothetical protein [Cyanobacteria bacterium UBA11371]HBE33709.1 hypothetical protein [Cyanobacteria bacterium UBA11368]HBE54490.1 hypothetical protein [Cyanobacteria bacterium UBA11369]